MLIGRWAACPALAVVFCAAAGARGDDEEVASIHTVARAAVADGRTARTKMLGFSIERGGFSETVGRGGVLVGFDLGMRSWFDSEVITAVRPIYRTATGLVTTRDYGSFVEKRKAEGRVPARDGITRVLKLRAKAGYVVTEVRLRTGLGIDALSLVYQRVVGSKLDPEDTYRSAWIGNVKGGSEAHLETGGMPIVGIFGNRDGNDRVNALGVIHIDPPKDRPKVVVKPAVSKPKPVEPPPVPPAEPPAAEKKQPEPVPEAGGKRYRDDVRGFKADLPAGWVRLLYLEQQQIRRQSPTILDAPETAYRPARAKAPPDTFVLIQSRPLVPGRKLDDLAAELTPFATFREAGGALADQAGGLTGGDMVLDRARHRFVWKTSTDTPGGASPACTSVTSAGRSR